jgi:hypothetical protein
MNLKTEIYIRKEFVVIKAICQKLLLFITIYFFNTTNCCFSQSNIARLGSVKYKNNEEVNGLFSIAKKHNVYNLRMHKYKIDIDLKDIKSFNIENRKYEIVHYEKNLLPLEILVEGELTLFFLEGENNFYIRDNENLYKLPQKYYKNFLQTLFNKKCNCNYTVSNNRKVNYNLIDLIEETTAFNLFASNQKFKVNPKRRAFKNEKTEIGISGFSFFETKRLYTSESRFNLKPELNNSIGINVRAKPYKKFQYTMDLYFHKVKKSTNILWSTSYNNWAGSVDTLTLKSFETNRIVLQNYFNYLFKFSSEQKLIPYIFIGPTFGIYVSKNGMVLNRRLNGFQANINKDYDFRTIKTFPFISVGGISGIGFNYSLHEKISLNFQTGYFTDFKNFNSDFNLIDNTMVLNVRSEMNRNLQAKIGMNFSF